MKNLVLGTRVFDETRRGRRALQGEGGRRRGFRSPPPPSLMRDGHRRVGRRSRDDRELDGGGRASGRGSNKNPCCSGDISLLGQRRLRRQKEGRVRWRGELINNIRFDYTRTRHFTHPHTRLHVKPACSHGSALGTTAALRTARAIFSPRAFNKCATVILVPVQRDIPTGPVFHRPTSHPIRAWCLWLVVVECT